VIIVAVTALGTRVTDLFTNMSTRVPDGVAH
jgi:Flp pilus assembly pilin Flp